MLLPSLNQVYQETKPNEPCDGGDKMLGTPSPYRSVIGCAPPPTKLSGFGSLQPYNFGTLGVHPLHTPVLGSQCLETYQVSAVLGPPCSRTLSPVPLSVLMYFSFLEYMASYQPFVVLCLGFEPW
jgi:hypothetical protein